MFNTRRKYGFLLELHDSRLLLGHRERLRPFGLLLRRRRIPCLECDVSRLLPMFRGFGVYTCAAAFRSHFLLRRGV